MELFILLAFVLLAGFFFVILSRWQRGGAKPEPDGCCGSDHSKCAHEQHQHDHKDGGCCGGTH